MITIKDCNISDWTLKCLSTVLFININNNLHYISVSKIRFRDFNLCAKLRKKQNGTKIVRTDSVRCVLYFALCLPTGTAVPLSHAQDGLLRGEN